MSVFDASTIASSAEIFAGTHTLPQIRAIHKSLHVQIEEKATRLRTQVGSSYRELLGTADTIVQMRNDNVAVQELLGQMGGRCGRAIVGDKVSGLADFVKGADRPELEEDAKVRLLGASVLVIGRLLKGGAVAGGELHSSATRGDRLVLAAKLLVLCRLLNKSFGAKVAESSRRYDIEASNKSLRSLRNRLTRNVEKALSSEVEDSDREDLLKVLCAYCLASSSGARDALRYFLNIRGRAMAFTLELEEGQREKRNEDIVKGLRLYTQSILDVQALVPSRLSQAVAALKSKPLFSEPALRQLDQLRLDVYGRWCGEDIEYFTSFIRHDDLDGKQAREMLFDWAKKGERVLLEGVEASMEHMSEFKSIMELRTSLLQLWIREGGKAKGIDPADMQDDLREVVNGRLLAVLEAKVKKLRIVGSEVNSTLDSWRSGVTDKRHGLWGEQGYDTALSDGAAPFIEEVVSRLFGRNDAVSKALNCYRSWFHVIDDVREVVQSLEKQRWDNDYDEIEDEETIQARQQILSQEDPKKLKEKLDSSLGEAFLELDQQFTKLWEEHASSPNAEAISIYLLRVVRDIRNQLPALGSVKRFGLGIVPSLHEKLTEHVAIKVLDNFASTGLSERGVETRALWEGRPPLPTQPSPGTFAFLRDLTNSMGEAGSDLWSPRAVKTVKEFLALRLGAMWNMTMADLESETTSVGHQRPKKKADEDDAEIKDSEKSETEGKDKDEEEEEEKDEKEDDKDSDEPSPDERKRDLQIQWLYDVAYLQQALALKRDDKTKDGQVSSPYLEDLEEKLVRQTGLDEASRQRMKKSADVFWQRTKLLFGLLA
ncbi:unnamed protein product [Clonostachys solani]|uniref:Conserved oligomeric Golgi complex subunit 1 n=1 Tax=Clonostachys solani TaxID=160281 RepID=A0A9N9VZF7_9HYPO|nr:unnamed protein product [Clonostachys solani]